jgi:quercetin dioxygenase-like cupin family protein
MRSSKTLFFLLLLSFASANTLSQSLGPGTAQSPVEIRNEPHHHLLLKNDYVRVWETLILAGDATLWHIHNNDNVVITLGDARVRVETVGAATAESLLKRGEVGFRKAPYVHRAISIGTTPFHNFAIEILKSPHNSQTLSKLKEQMGREPIIENDGVRVYRVALSPSESTGMLTHPLSGLMVTIMYGEIVVQRKGKDKPEQTKVAAGNIRWITGPLTYSIKNVGTTVFEALDIELK